MANVQPGPVTSYPNTAWRCRCGVDQSSRLICPRLLLDRLASWQQEFEDNYDPFAGWKSHEVRATWARKAHNLEFDLRRVSPDDVELAVDLWPIESE